MVVILSYSGDDNTNKLKEWLKFYEVSYKRVHLENENFQNIEISTCENRLNCFLSLVDGSKLDFRDISFFVFEYFTGH